MQRLKSSAAGRAVDQYGQADAPVDALKRGQHGIDRLGLLRLNCRASCLHDLSPVYVGQRLDGAAGLLHRAPAGKAGNARRGQPDFDSGSVKPAARLNNMCVTVKAKLMSSAARW